MFNVASYYDIYMQIDEYVAIKTRCLLKIALWNDKINLL